MSLYAKLKFLLIEAGLSEADALIYTELVKSPVENAYALVAKTGLNRNAVYRAIAKLKDLKLIVRTPQNLKALSLKSLVAELKTSSLRINKTAYKIKSIAPFLKAPRDSIESFEHFYTPDQIAEAYLFMAEQAYRTNLDFGDFENFVPTLKGELQTAYKFRTARVKHASHHAICTTFGPKTESFCTRESKVKFKNRVSLLKTSAETRGASHSDFKNKFIIFSDTCDYVLFNDFADAENPISVLIKSKAVADIQRGQFDLFSQKVENL